MAQASGLDAYRAPMRSRRDDVDPALAVGRALELGLCGMGAVRNERDQRRVERFADVPDESFVWTRSDAGFHLGRLTGAAREDRSNEAVTADLVHVRPCEWLPEPVDPVLVPEQVRYAFSRGGRNFQRIGIPGSGDASARVWKHLTV